MEQYIPKSTVVAEINRRIEKCDIFYIVADNNNAKDAMEEIKREIQHYKSLLDFLNTLETKDVDIRNEVSDWWNNHYTGAKKNYTFEGYSGHYLDNSTIINLAQYFYELGIRVQKEK